MKPVNTIRILNKYRIIRKENVAQNSDCQRHCSRKVKKIIGSFTVRVPRDCAKFTIKTAKYMPQSLT